MALDPVDREEIAGSDPVPNPFARRAWALTWMWSALIGTFALVFVFASYEVLERRWLRHMLSAETLWTLHMVRGMGASILVGTITFLNVWRIRRRYDKAFAEAYRRVERAMEARSARARQLEAQLRDQEKLAAIGVLTSGIAHDIANPLASMSSELELLEGETDLGAVRRSLGVLRHHIDRITRTLREMREFARRRGEEVGPIEVALAVDDALRMVRHDPRARRVRMRAELPSELPRIRMVEDHFVSVLVNLLINALDAMPDGGEIVVAAEEVGGFVRVAVSDTGTGMTEAVLRRATEPLFTTKGVRGTGLGLSVSNDMMRAAGGSLEIESAPDQGTTVYLTCPTVSHG